MYVIYVSTDFSRMHWFVACEFSICVQ